MESRAGRSAAVVFVALVFATLAAFLAAGSEARAQTTTDPVAEEFRLSPEERRILDNSRFQTAGPDQAKAGRARSVWTRAMKAVPRAAPVLARAGLGATAGTVWGRNLVVFKTSITGDTFYIGADFDAKPAAGAHVIQGTNYDNTQGTRAVLASINWRMDSEAEGCTPLSSRCYVTSEVKLYRSVANVYCSSYSSCQARGGVAGGLPASSVQLTTSPIHSTAVKGATWDPLVSKKETAMVYLNSGKQAYVADSSEAPSTYGTGPYRLVTDLCTKPGCTTSKQFDTFEVGEVKDRPNYSPQPGDFVVEPDETKRVVAAIKEDHEYDPCWAKPWLCEGFRAPSDPLQREALWGPVVGTWTTPSGGECKEYQYGAKVCDYPDGSTFVWIVSDRSMWMQASSGGDGGKDWIIRPPNLSSGGGVSGGGASNQKPTQEADDIGYLESQSMAFHVVEALKQGDEHHRLPGVQPPDSVEAVQRYIEETVDKVELSGKRFYRETDAVGVEALSGPYYFLYTYGYYAGQHKKAYWDAKNGVIIIRDPASKDGGTAFKPDAGEEYRKANFPNTWHDRRRP